MSAPPQGGGATVPGARAANRRQHATPQAESTYSRDGSSAEPRDSDCPTTERDIALRLLYDSLASMPTKELNAYLRLLRAVEELSPEGRGLLFRLLVRDIKDAELAAICRVARTTIYKWPSLMRLKRLERAMKAVEIPRGVQDLEGFLEAWYEQENR